MSEVEITSKKSNRSKPKICNSTVDYSSYNKNELINLCKERTIKGYSNKNKAELIDLLTKSDNGTLVQKIKENKSLSTVDNYSEDILKELYNQFKTNYLERNEIKNKYGLKIRLPIMPEDVSENIVKFILKNKLENKNIKWSKTIKRAGDLYDCDKNKTLEVKAFMSDGPLSFGPKEAWDDIYFLDSRRTIIDNKFILYYLPYSNTSELWKNIKVNSTTTFEEQADNGKRPRNNWESIKSKLKDNIIKIFEGSFDDIFITEKEEESTYQQSV